MCDIEPTTPAAAPRPPRANRRALRVLREPIPEHNVGKRPRVYCWACNEVDKQRPGQACEDHEVRWCGKCRSRVSNAHDHDDYVGHAEMTDRFLEADLLWTWEPMALDERGLPALDDDGGLWIRLTIGGVTRPGYGSSSGKTGGAAISEAISNALKSAGQRFGVGLNQRARTDLHAKAGAFQDVDAPPAEPEYARPDWIARVNSLLARKRDAHGQDRPRVLSEILRCEITDVQKLSPAQARDAVQILYGDPDLNPPAPAAEPGPDPVAEPSAEEPSAEPAPTPAPPQPSPRRNGPGPGAANIRTINSLLNSRGVPVDDTPARMRIISTALGRTIKSLTELSPADALALIPGLGSGDISVDPQPAAAPATADGTEPGPGIVDELLGQISQAITDEDAVHIKVQIGKALTSELIAKTDALTLVNRLEERGRQVGLAGVS